MAIAFESMQYLGVQMEQVIKVPDIQPERGLQFEWEDGFEISLSATSAEVVLRANRAGLVSLARHLLTLAQEGVSSGAHVHLTADQEIESNMDLILELMT
ncbi:Imm32 family immunity protein [Kitasatospora purpeofusca]|uniref:Imm32 family immunity protein n=1 Tax=Kitasatospora purpeofusca TaxID=67352 RepID=UPI0036A3D985